MPWMPTARLLMLHVAVRVLPEPESATFPQFTRETLFSWKLTLPPGFAPEIVAVNVTFAPTIAGFGAPVSIVVDVVTPVPPAAITAAAASMMPAPQIAVLQSLPEGNARAEVWIFD